MKYFLITQLIFWITVVSSAIIFFFFYRFYFFLRDPKRKITQGNNILAPADGYVVYIKTIENNELPISIKKGNRILINEILENDEHYNILIGIFMTPLSVHHNRFPFSGKITGMFHKKSETNMIMTRGFMNLLFNLKPYEENAEYIVHNERHVTFVENKDMKCAIVQIADKWVNRIENCHKTGDDAVKGEKLGMIRMGSQCDLYIKIKKDYKLLVRERDYVKAGISELLEVTE